MKTNLKSYQKLDLVQGSDEWKAERLKHVTASNVPAIFGLSPYKTKLQYFEELTLGVEPSVSDEKQVLFNIGHDAEVKGREYVEKTYGVPFPPAVVISPACPELLASLDGFNEEYGIIFESKYVGREILTKMREQPGWLPAHHECQIQAQLLATGATKCIYFALDPDGEAATLEVTPIAEYQRDIVMTVIQFMKDAREGNAPEPSELDFFTPVDERFAELRDAKIKADEAAARFEEMKAFLVDQYKDHARIRAGGLTVVRSVTKGSIQYAKIPVLKNVDLEKYRAPSRVSVTVRLDKKAVSK